MDQESGIEQQHNILGNGNQEVPLEEVLELGIENENETPGRNGTGQAPGANHKPVLAQAALHGLPGRIVTTVDPFTEADPVAIIITILVMFGSVIGRKPYFKVEETNHYTNLFTALVGPSSSGRKGQSQS